MIEKHDHGLLWITNAPMFGVHINEKNKQFINMYIFCNVSLLPNPSQIVQQHQHTCICKEKTHVVCIFHYPLHHMHKTKILDILEMNMI
jgi:hypothetical protein